ncbi:aminotransferase class V-fold PLP-dependent enzyme [bacterium]|nr:aminotransferase class V-fold PLP-dependent enzyme [bacterium]
MVHDEGRDRCGIVTFTVDGIEPADVQSRLRRDGINVSAPGRRNVQRDLWWRNLDAVVRAGVHYFNSLFELDTTLEVISAMRS